jgi:hypothetical protein
LSIDTSLLREILIKYRMEETQDHLKQALDSFENHNYEAANAQLRASLEAFFNYMIQSLLDSSKTGGAARHELHKLNYITPSENELLKYFFKLAGENGSHPGKSNEAQSLSNIYIGLGIMWRMLRLLPNEVTVVKAFELAGIGEKADDLTKWNFVTECPTCLEKQSINECKTYVIGRDTIHECKNGCQQIVLVAKFMEGNKPIEQRGYRLKDYVIRNAKDIVITIPGASKKLLIPASKNAFRKY